MFIIRQFKLVAEIEKCLLCICKA